MSDIGLGLSGLIALSVCVLSAIVLAVGAVISLIIAFFAGGKTWQGTKQSGAFGFFIAAVLQIVLNLVLCGALLLLLDTLGRDVDQVIDNIAFFAWLPLMAIVWVVLGLVFKKRRSN